MGTASRLCTSCDTPVPSDAAFCPACGAATPTDLNTAFGEGFEQRLAAALRDRYRIEREVGRGGMAVVYLAHDLRHERQVAVKVLRPELAASLGAERFQREIKLAAKLTHQNVLALYDSGDADGFLYYVMPYVEGESLRHKLNCERQLPIADALRLTREIAEGLDYAHEQGIVHRDIKPENILFQRGHALVADFGIARAVAAAGEEALTETGLSLGTPHYMSPEQASGDRAIDARSDIYALGCVVYEALVGEPPFMGNSAASIMAKHVTQPAPSARRLRAAVPEAVDASLRKAMAKLPVDRYQSAGAFAAALGESKGARKPIPTGRRVAGLAILLAAVAVSVLWLGPRSGARARGKSATPDTRRIAVLYFDDLSPAGEATYLADGLTEGLIHELSQVDELEVISRNGVKPYRNADSSVANIARTLQVGTFVEGSVQRVGDSVRVTVQLIDAVTLRHLGSRTVNRRWGDWLALQDDVSQEVAWFLRERLGHEIVLRERRSGTSSSAAWELVQRASQAITEVPPGGTDPRVVRDRLDQADEWLRQAAELAPAWTEPLILRGQIALLAWHWAGGVLDSATVWRLDSLVQRAVGFADRALALKPDPAALTLRGDAYAQRAWLERDAVSRQRWLDLAERDLRTAVQGDGGQAQAWASLGRVLQLTGRYADADAAARQALDVDPFLQNASELMELLFSASLELGDDDDALEWCRTGRMRFPNSTWTADCELTLMVTSDVLAPDPQQAQQLVTAYLGRFAEAPRDFRATLEANWRIALAGVLARAGRMDSARAIVRQRSDRWRADSTQGFSMHELYVALLVEDSTVISLVARIDSAGAMDTVFMAGDFWGRAILRDTVVRRRARLPVR